MARPTRRTIASGIAAWDADTDENFDNVTGKPLALFQVVAPDDETDLPAATAYDDCFALVDSTLYISNGTTWEVYSGVSANVADSTATTATQMATDFNLLLTALQDAGIMA